MSDESVESLAPDAIQEAPSLTVQTDTLKATGPILVVWALLAALLALPLAHTALVAAEGGDPLAAWGRLAGTRGFWWVAAPYAAVALLIGYYVWILTRRLLIQPTILLTPEGFEVTDEAGVRFTAWGDVEAFDVAYDPDNHREHFGWRYRLGAARVSEWDRPARNLDKTFGMGWQGSVPDLRDTFEAWRRRYSAGRTD